MKFKIGDFVRVKDKHSNNDLIEVGHIGKIEKIDENNPDYPYRLENNSTCLRGEWLELISRTIEDVQEDDLITDGTYLRRVLGRCGKVVFLTYFCKEGEIEETFYDCGYSIAQLKESNYSIVENTPEHIEINGKKYNKEDVDKRLSELSPIE